MKSKILRLLCLALLSFSLVALTSCLDVILEDDEEHTHTYGEWYENSATCTADGEERRDCTAEDCDGYETRATTALGHQMTDWSESESATCTDDGEERRDCEREGCEHYETRATTAPGHQMTDWSESESATCTEDGEERRDCEREGCEHYETRPTAKLNHDMGSWYGDTATCTEDGEERRDCERDSCEHYETRPTAKLNHDMGSWYGDTSTCTEDGEERRDCEREGCEHYETRPTTAPGHNFVDDECTRCQATVPYSVGLEFMNMGNNTCYVKGIGTCQDTDILIPKKSPEGYTVVGIYLKAFQNKTAITSVTIPNTVQFIGNNAFSGCKNLTSVTMPGSIVSIGSNAFYGCNNLAGVYVSDIANWCGILFADDWANPVSFSKKLYIDGNLVSELVIPEGVKKIEKYAFYKCESLKSVTLSDSVAEIDERAFQNCTGLASVEFGSGVRNIYQYAFYNCTSLASITVDEDNANYKSVDGNLYSKNGETLIMYAIGKTAASFTVPYGVRTINARAFERCAHLKSVTISDSVTYIGDYAFNSCSRLERVAIGNKVELICQYAFKDCYSLQKLVIPDSVRSIAKYAFQNCYNLTSVKIGEGMRKDGFGTGSFSNCHRLVEVIANSYCNNMKGQTTYGSIGKNALEIHKGDSQIKEFDGFLFITSGGVNYLIGYVGNATVLTLPESYNGENYEINKYAFYECDGVTSVIIPDSVTKIGENAFANCSGLTKVIIGDGVTAIGDYAFYNCVHLTSVTIAEKVVSIAQFAFSNCYKLVEVINKSDLDIRVGNVTGNGYVSSNALVVHKGESKVVNKDGYLFITDSGVNYLLGYVGSATTLTLPESYNGENYKIYKRAFEGCTELTSVVISKGISEICGYAFLNCSNLTSVKYSGSETEWAELKKDASWNSNAGSFTITYNYTSN